MASKRRINRKLLRKCKGKLSFDTEAEAKNSAYYTTRMKGRKFTKAGITEILPIRVYAYKCKLCNRWKLGT